MNNLIIYKKRILENFEIIKQKTKSKICVVVKCNGYGLGYKQIVNALSNSADFFAVSSVSEALQIRKITKTASLLILDKIYDYKKAIKNNISITIDNKNDLINVIKISKSLSKKAKIHIKINSGMNRFGVDKIEQFKNLLNKFNNKYIELEGVFTHFCTTTTDLEFFNKQKQIFDKFLKVIPENLSPIIHIGGSGVIDNLDTFYDMTRVGIRLYTYPKTIFKLESRVIKIRNLKKGERLGYDNGITTDHNCKVAIVCIGYGDGLKMEMQNLKVMIGGREFDIIGKLCMDTMFIKVDKKVQVGDKVDILFDRENLKAKGISEYDILTSLNSLRGKRVLRG